MTAPRIETPCYSHAHITSIHLVQCTRLMPTATRAISQPAHKSSRAHSRPNNTCSYPNKTQGAQQLHDLLTTSDGFVELFNERDTSLIRIIPEIRHVGTRQEEHDGVRHSQRNKGATTSRTGQQK